MKGTVVFQSSPTEGWYLHAFSDLATDTPTFLHHCWPPWIPPNGNRMAKLLCNWNFIEDGTCSNHSDTWDGHILECLETKLFTFSVITLKCSNGICNHLWLRINRTEQPILLDNQKNDCVNVDEAYIRHGRHLCIVATDCERNVYACTEACACPNLVETHNLKHSSCNIIDGTLLDRTCMCCQVYAG